MPSTSIKVSLSNSQCLWRCEHWRTATDDLKALKEDLQRVEAELEIATKLEMLRQQQGLASDQQRLAIRIQGLEKIDDRG